MKLSKEFLKELVRETMDEETLDLGALAGSSEDDNHLMLLETAARYKAIAKAKPEWADELGGSIKQIYNMFKRTSRRLRLEK